MQTEPRGAGGAIPRPRLFAAGARRRTPAVPALASCAVVFCVAFGGVARADTLVTGIRTGHASWYGDEFARRPTASGEQYDPGKLTGAHRTLPLGSTVRVTNLSNGRSVLVKINDRGPYVRQREIDLSYGAARALGMIRRGVTRVRIEPVES